MKAQMRLIMLPDSNPHFTPVDTAVSMSLVQSQPSILP